MVCLFCLFINVPIIAPFRFRTQTKKPPPSQQGKQSKPQLAHTTVVKKMNNRNNVALDFNEARRLEKLDNERREAEQKRQRVGEERRAEMIRRGLVTVDYVAAYNMMSDKCMCCLFVLRCSYCFIVL
jgi:hypothetical protein